MADIKQGRWTAEIEGDFVVFIIGARVNGTRPQESTSPWSRSAIGPSDGSNT
jgi:hypothetical protein